MLFFIGLKENIHDPYMSSEKEFQTIDMCINIYVKLHYVNKITFNISKYISYYIYCYKMKHMQSDMGTLGKAEGNQCGNQCTR